ncbi:MAG: alkaline shock response membrane anchor protein AmaP [Oscillospiraceae bacterium]|nr:alkaline shock response membrane anchor protein AmaP [Oscillospiraceae bacterium]
MTLKWYDRALIALGGLVLVALGVFSVLLGSGLIPANAWGLDIWLGDGWQWMPILCVVGVLLAAWGLRMIWRQLFKGRGGAYYRIGGAGEAGGVQIAVQALDHLVRKSLDTHPEILASRIRVGGQEEAMQITLRLTLRTGVRIPVLVEQVRREIKAYVEECAGVTVRQIEIIVESTKDARGGAKEVQQEATEIRIAELPEPEPEPMPEPTPEPTPEPMPEPEPLIDLSPDAFPFPEEAEPAEEEVEAVEIPLAPDADDEGEGEPIHV